MQLRPPPDRLARRSALASIARTRAAGSCQRRRFQRWGRDKNCDAGDETITIASIPMASALAAEQGEFARLCVRQSSGALSDVREGGGGFVKAEIRALPSHLVWSRDGGVSLLVGRCGRRGLGQGRTNGRQAYGEINAALTLPLSFSNTDSAARCCCSRCQIGIHTPRVRCAPFAFVRQISIAFCSADNSLRPIPLPHPLSFSLICDALHLAIAVATLLCTMRDSQSAQCVLGGTSSQRLQY